MKFKEIEVPVMVKRTVIEYSELEKIAIRGLVENLNRLIFCNTKHNKDLKCFISEFCNDTDSVFRKDLSDLERPFNYIPEYCKNCGYWNYKSHETNPVHCELAPPLRSALTLYKQMLRYSDEEVKQ